MTGGRGALGLTVAVLGLVAPGAAGADVALGDRGARGWFAGVNLRTDMGVHRARVGGGVRTGRLALTLVVDPKVFVDPKQNDTDALAEWMFAPGGWAALAGWRVTQLSIDRGRQVHQMLLLGGTGGLPALGGGRIRSRLGAELEVTVLRFGAGLPTEVISFDGSRSFYDLVTFNLFLRIEYAAGR